MRKGRAPTSKIAISPQFLTLDHHFVRKGCAQTCEIAILLHVWTSKRIMIQSRRPPMPCRHTKSTIYFSFRRSKLVSCERAAAEGVKSQFHRSFWRSKLVSCERVAAEVVIAILFQFLAIEARFVRKGCCRGCNIAISPQFRSNLISISGCRRGCNIAILLQFLAIQPCFVRKGFAFRAVSLALPRALREK